LKLTISPDLQGMGDQCKRVKQQMPKTTQVVLFSATFPQEVLDFANLFAPKSNQITLEVEKLTVKGIKQMVSIRLPCDTFAA
jgi:ATP-dependent RNA helicase DDX19/DBP5